MEGARIQGRKTILCVLCYFFSVFLTNEDKKRRGAGVKAAECGDTVLESGRKR